MTREVEARLKISARDATGRTFGAIAGKLGEIDKRAAAFNRRQGVMARQAQETFGIISRYAAPAVLGYAAVGAVKDFAALERQMTRIGITADASAAQTAEAFRQAQQVAKDLNYDSVQPAIEGLDTLVASGQSLEEAMAFLPAVLATAQASGAATADIANTGLKAASALKIEAGQLQRAFDIMVAGGKAGQFELKDMAQYIPGLANSFATLGYDGEDGLKRLVSILQTIREDTGDASSAATQAQNIFGKMFSEETSNKFKKFGIDIRKEMEAAKASGEDAVSAFVRLSEEAIKGDYSKLPLLFSDQEFRLGMQSLMTSGESLEKFLKVMNSAEVDGTVFRDINRVISDTQASVDRMTNSWETLKTSLGKAVAPVATEGMDALSGSLDYHGSVNAGLEKSGIKGFWNRTQFGLTSSADEKMRMAIRGGYNNREDVADYYMRQYESGSVKASVGRQGRPVSKAEFPGVTTGQIPVPARRPSEKQPSPVAVKATSVPAAPADAAMGQNPFRIPSKAEWKEALKIELGFKQAQREASQSAAAASSTGPNTIRMPTQEDVKAAFAADLGVKREGEQAAQAVADGGKQAGQAIEESAAFIKVAGYDVSTAIANAAKDLLAAATAINRLNFGGVAASNGGGSAPPQAVRANTGRSMPASAGRPPGTGRQ